ncbi:MAG: argininosuccinate lyase [Mariprofundaceae bacterium]|nr:argininosuccinate lyase [Mariprofundaceae bacterium]
MSDKPWGGRFDAPTNAFVEAFNASTDVDQRMYAQDIEGSRAHATMLHRQSILSSNELKKILNGLDEIEGEIERGEFAFLIELEDVHMNIERRLTERVGEAGKKLHTARSRNDQVATGTRLYLRQRTDHVLDLLRQFQMVLVDIAQREHDTIMPGFTHLQSAQPVTFGHHMLAYVEMLDRDHGRFCDARKRMNECPLGSAALAGTTFNIDRQFTSDQLGFDRPCANSLDGVSDRDFVVELLAASSLCAVHLSRFCEELILWMSAQFSFIELSDAFCTGSSIMPQKKNPDMPELIRGKTGRIVGGLVTMLVNLKSLPLAYNKDMQEDKAAVFDTFDQLSASLRICIDMLPEMTVNRDKLYDAASSGHATATDLADHLVRAGVSFRDAHAIVGKAVAYCIRTKKELHTLSVNECADLDAHLSAEMISSLSVEACVAARKHLGGCAPQQVQMQCTLWKDRLENQDA